MSEDDRDFLPPAQEDESEGQPAEAGGTTALAKGQDEGDRAPGERAELPTWNRSRRKRKANVEAEKQDDVFQRGVRKASRQAIDAPKLALGAIVIGVVIIAGGVAIAKRKVQGNAEAARTLQSATAAIVRAQVVAPEELERLGDVVKQYRFPIFTTEEERQAAIDEALAAARSSGREGVEQNAQLVAAAQAMRAGEFDAALSEYDAFLSAVDEDHRLRFLALEGKGNALEAKGELEAALEVFRQIAPQPSDYYRPMALYHQGRVLEALERSDEAVALYKQYFEEFKSEEMATPMVRERLEALDPEFAARLAAPPPSPFPTP